MGALSQILREQEAINRGVTRAFAPTQEFNNFLISEALRSRQINREDSLASERRQQELDDRSEQREFNRSVREEQRTQQLEDEQNKLIRENFQATQREQKLAKQTTDTLSVLKQRLDASNENLANTPQSLSDQEIDAIADKYITAEDGTRVADIQERLAEAIKDGNAEEEAFIRQELNDFQAELLGRAEKEIREKQKQVEKRFKIAQSQNRDINSTFNDLLIKSAGIQGVDVLSFLPQSQEGPEIPENLISDGVSSRIPGILTPNEESSFLDIQQDEFNVELPPSELDLINQSNDATQKSINDLSAKIIPFARETRNQRLQQRSPLVRGIAAISDLVLPQSFEQARNLQELGISEDVSNVATTGTATPIGDFFNIGGGGPSAAIAEATVGSLLRNPVDEAKQKQSELTKQEQTLKAIASQLGIKTDN